jgi:hypothetical protein
MLNTRHQHRTVQVSNRLQGDPLIESTPTPRLHVFDLPIVRAPRCDELQLEDVLDHGHIINAHPGYRAQH